MTIRFEGNRSDCCICREMFDMATLVPLIEDSPPGAGLCFTLACRPCAEAVGGAQTGIAFGELLDIVSPPETPPE